MAGSLGDMTSRIADELARDDLTSQIGLAITASVTSNEVSAVSAQAASADVALSTRIDTQSQAVSVLSQAVSVVSQLLSTVAVVALEPQGGHGHRAGVYHREIPSHGGFLRV